MRNLLALPGSLGERSVAKPQERVAGTLMFDLIMIALASWFIGGLYLDGWAHQHIPALETFFTPWHGVLYSGFLACAGFLTLAMLRNMMRGYSAWQALPCGYELSLVGVLIFTFGGLGDLTWHTLLGIEADTEALLSPPHLLLALGMMLIMSGPLRAAWYRTERLSRRWLDRLPMVISLAFMLSLLTFFTQYVHPFGRTLAAAANAPGVVASDFGQLTENGLETISFYQQSLGVSGFLLQSAFLMGLVLFVVQRGLMPVGGMTLILTLNLTGMVLMRDQSFGENPIATGVLPMVGVAVLSGLAVDLLNQWLKPSSARPVAFRIFAFATPALLYGFYFAALHLFGGLGWSLPMWGGAIVLAGAVGLLLSYAFVPPARAETVRA